MKDFKVFGIGFHKTGTSSLAKALKMLGCRVTGPNGVENRNIAQEVHKMASELVPHYDAFQDNPWPVIYRELDEKYPGSKFILTMRPVNEWIRSAVRHFGAESTPMREWIYGVGCPSGNEEIYRARYERHNNEVREYFKDRPDDLLVLWITQGEGWEKLCPFLGEKVPSARFPHANKGKIRKKGLRQWLRRSKGK